MIEMPLSALLRALGARGLSLGADVAAEPSGRDGIVTVRPTSLAGGLLLSLLAAGGEP